MMPPAPLLRPLPLAVACAVLLATAAPAAAATVGSDIGGMTKLG